MTDKSNCAQLQVIFQSLGRQSCLSSLHCGFWRVEKEKSEKKWKWKYDEIFTPFDVKIIQIRTFPANPSTQQVPCLAKRVAYSRHLIIQLESINSKW